MIVLYLDKHKAHHIRDEQLIKDGFKKFMKTDACLYSTCVFSRVVNHIHCIREGIQTLCRKRNLCLDLRGVPD